MALVTGEVKPGFLAESVENVTLIPLPPQNGGAIGWGKVYLSFGSDFGDVTLRVAVYNVNAKHWKITEKVLVPASGDRVNIAISDGDAKVSVARVATNASDKGIYPCAYMVETTLKA
jgi:hypothetical protein